MKCPNCGSGNTKKSSAMHQQAARFYGSSAGWWISSRGTVGIGKRRSQSRMTSDALEANAPPEPSPLIGCAAGLPLGLMLLLALTGWLPLWLLLVLGFGTSIACATWAYCLERPDLDQRTVDYERQWYCFKCGTIFENGSVPEFGTHSADIRLSLPTSEEAQRWGDRQDYIDRVLVPIQRTTQPTSRDLYGLEEILRRSHNVNGRHIVEPEGMDKGIVSRLASLDLIRFDEEAGEFWITEGGVRQAQAG